MKEKILTLFLILVLVVPGFTACGQGPDRETLTQISTIDAILNGVYDGVITVGELVEYGDFGIGTFEGLDGEMVVLDGKVFQVKADGVAYLVDAEVLTPFASVTFFDTDSQIELSGENANLTYTECQQLINDSLPTENIFCAIKITGTFSYMKTRSVPGQQKPYPPLVDVTKDQPIFEFTEVTGTIVGFFCPTYVEGVNVVGYHLHFINTDESAGGHVLDFIVTDITISIDYTPVFTMILPGMDSDFYQLDLTPDLSEELEQAEK